MKCLVSPCPNRALAGRSRCQKHNRKGGRTGPSPYDSKYELQAKRCLSRRPLVCHICGEGVEAVPLRGPFEADHIVPLSLGGPATYDNLAPAHKKCNVAKGGANRRRPR